MATEERVIKGLAMVPLTELHPSPTNPRERLTGLDELAASIRENGLIQPVIAQKIPGRDGFQLVAGHRRAAAARMAGLDRVPCVVRRDMLPDEELLAMIVENGQRTDLDPIEEAKALASLKAQGQTAAEVARQIGRSPQYVGRRIDLLRLPLAQQEEIRAGHVSVSYANQHQRDRRQAERQALNPVARPVGRPKGRRTTPYFGDTHPLAKAARARCKHKGAAKVAGVACGPCIEAVIREDERCQNTTDQETP